MYRLREPYKIINPMAKGDKANCLNPKCGKQFIQTNGRHKCCSNSCRTLYNRHKKGEPLYPTFLNYDPATTARKTGYVQSGGTGFESLFGSVLSTGAGAAIGHAAKGISKGSVLGAVTSTVLSSALTPYLQKVIKSGMRFSFSSITTELEVWKARLSYWNNRKSEALNGVLPMKTLGIGAGVSAIAYGLTEDKDKKANRAFLFGLVGGAIGAYLDHKDYQTQQINKQFIIEEADKAIIECNRNIDILSNERTAYQQLVDEEVLVDDGNGTYVVSDEILNGSISSKDYQKLEIESIKFKGQYNFLLGTPGANFYKIVTGNPGNGKTTYSFLFSNYFANNHGNVLYFPAEQSGENVDVQNLLKRTNINSDNFTIQKNVKVTVDDIIALIHLRKIKLVVFDSVNKMKLTPDDISIIRDKCKDVAILAVMQSTKEGSFKGSQEYYHDCDIFIELENFVAHQTKARSAGAEKLHIDKLVVI